MLNREFIFFFFIYEEPKRILICCAPEIQREFRFEFTDIPIYSICKKNTIWMRPGIPVWVRRNASLYEFEEFDLFNLFRLNVKIWMKSKRIIIQFTKNVYKFRKKKRKQTRKIHSIEKKPETKRENTIEFWMKIRIFILQSTCTQLISTLHCSPLQHCTDIEMYKMSSSLTSIEFFPEIFWFFFLFFFNLRKNSRNSLLIYFLIMLNTLNCFDFILFWKKIMKKKPLSSQLKFFFFLRNMAKFF